MPIKINLLADQIAAEEIRRKDPVKRTIIIGSGLIALLFLYSLSLQFKVRAAKSEMLGFQNRLKSVEDTSKQVKADRTTASDVDKKLTALDRFSTNRFFWGSALDALQRTMVPNIRLTQIQSEQKYVLVDPNKFHTATLVIPVTPIRKWFGLSVEAPDDSSITALVTNQFKTLVNKPPFTTNRLDYSTKITLTATNASKTEVTAKVEFSLPLVSREETTLEISGRDYAPPPGALDDFTRTAATLPFFKQRLKEGETGGINTKERPPQPRLDPQEPWESRPFIPFTIQCDFQPRILSNE